MADLRAAVIAFVLVTQGACDFISDEENLRATLFSSYNAKVRPADVVHVFVGISLSSMNELMWQDDRLRWNASDYGGIAHIVVPKDDVWTPPIVIENSVQDVGVLGGEERDNTPVRFNSSGVVVWSPPTEVTFTCRMKIAKYPFDKQECYLKVLGWTYPISEVIIHAEGIDTKALFTPSGEFDLIETRLGYEDITPDLNTTYRKLQFYLTFRRKWQFYGMNLVMPIVLSSILMATVFALPIESGEKMSFSLTVLLSYVVFLTWVTDNLPPVSTDVSVLQVYLAVILCLGVLATLSTTWILYLYYTPPEKSMHRAYVVFASRVLVPLRDFIFCRKDTVKVDVTAQSETSQQQHDVSYLPKYEWREITVLPLSKPEAFQKEEKENNTEEDKKNEAREATREFTWQELAALFDRFFLVVFSFLVFITTTVLIGLLYDQY